MYDPLHWTSNAPLNILRGYNKLLLLVLLTYVHCRERMHQDMVKCIRLFSTAMYTHHAVERLLTVTSLIQSLTTHFKHSS